MFTSTINRVLLTMVWTEDDLRKALEEAGLPSTQENIDRFIDEGGFEDMKDQISDLGLEVLDRIIRRIFE